jgi:hypothetical protein
MSTDIISVQFKQQCLSINSVRNLFQVYKTSKKIFVIFEKFINKGLECKYMLANGITQPFQTSIGVKQGCVLRTTFFPVYMNDLVEHFNLECDPVSINGKYFA